MTYTAATTLGVRDSAYVQANLALATTKDIRNSSAWIRHGNIRKDGKWSKSGSLLIRPDNGTHLLFFGDSNNGQGMEWAISKDLLNYTIQPGIWLPIRKDHFDNGLVEGGPAPERLSNGQYLYIHNSAGNYNGTNGYNVGFVILDAVDPSIILFRTPIPILSCEMGWEKGQKPWLGLTANVVFTEGMRRYPEGGENSFLFYYGAADSVMGAAIVTVTVSNQQEDHRHHQIQPFEESMHNRHKQPRIPLNINRKSS